MSDDSYTEVTRESWFGRLGNSIKGIVVGLVLVIGAPILLSWNEARSIERYKTLKEGSGVVISVSADRVDAGNEGKLVHLSGFATTDETLTDPDFHISVNAIKLDRVAEMYQWKEEKESKTQKKVGGGSETTTTYSYTKVWSKDLIDSNGFKQSAAHSNPSSMRFASREMVADHVTLGGFALSSPLVSKINSTVPLSVDAAGTAEKTAESMPTVSGEGYYFGADSASPQIGDLKITFRVVKPQEVSVVARQVGGTFEPYMTKAGGTIELLDLGIRSAQGMFQEAQTENKVLTWILRAVGFVLMLVGFAMIFGPLGVLADVIPFLGSIVSMGTGLVALVLALVLSSITIGIAWIAVRPLLGIPLLLGGVAALVLLVLKRPARGKTAQ